MKTPKLLLGVGAMKSGTTWLYRQLEQHPLINFSLEKEIHFLAHRDGQKNSLNFTYRLSRCRVARQRALKQGKKQAFSELLWYLDYLLMPKNWSWYKRRFGDIKTGAYCADFSNLSAILSADSWQRLRDDVDDLRLIYILRNPLERIWSNIKFSQGAEYKGDEESVSRNLLENGFLAHSSYVKNISTILKIVPRAKLLLIDFDDIKKRPDEVIKSVEDFLGLPRHSYLIGKVGRKINASVEMKMPTWVYERYADECFNAIDGLEGFGFDVPEAWRKRG